MTIFIIGGIIATIAIATIVLGDVTMGVESATNKIGWMIALVGVVVMIIGTIVSII